MTGAPVSVPSHALEPDVAALEALVVARHVSANVAFIAARHELARILGSGSEGIGEMERVVAENVHRVLWSRLRGKFDLKFEEFESPAVANEAIRGALRAELRRFEQEARVKRVREMTTKSDWWLFMHNYEALAKAAFLEYLPDELSTIRRL